MGTKNAKGTVSIENIDKRIRLRWRFQKKRYSLNLFHFTKTNQLLARNIAFQIEREMFEERFDTSLTRYKPAVCSESPKTKMSLVDHFQYWVINYRNMSCDKDIDYYSIRNMMHLAGNNINTCPLLPIIQGAILPLTMACSNSTLFNSRLHFIMILMGY